MFGVCIVGGIPFQMLSPMAIAEVPWIFLKLEERKVKVVSEGVELAI